MSRFFIPQSSIRGDTIHITGREMHHIIDVMRLKTLDRIVTFDGTGKEYIGFIHAVTSKAVEMKIVETRSREGLSQSSITLIQSVTKKDKMDYIVEKGTELGVKIIRPLITARTVPDWTEAKKIAIVERWRKIAIEAAKQCGRSDIPVIHDVASFDNMIINITEYDMAMIAALDETSVKIKDILSNFSGGKLAIAIGPEGDFTPDEIKLAKDIGYKLVNLGSRVLKSDTAGLFVLSAINYELS